VAQTLPPADRRPRRSTGRRPAVFNEAVVVRWLESSFGADLGKSHRSEARKCLSPSKRRHLSVDESGISGSDLLWPRLWTVRVCHV